MTEPNAELHHDHQDVSGGWLRASVFGAMDGLVSNLALISGMAGGSASASTVALAGVAGLAAGAFSMAAGEFVSVRSQNELAEREVAIERAEILRVPEAELAELARDLRRPRGVDLTWPSRSLARSPPTRSAPCGPTRCSSSGSTPVSSRARYVAAGSSFVAFCLGAFIPLLPYLLGATTLMPAIVLASIGLFGAGALVSRVTARTWWYSGLRQLASAWPPRPHLRGRQPRRGSGLTPGLPTCSVTLSSA